MTLRTSSLLGIVFVFLISSTQLCAQNSLTTAQWQEDLQFLQDQVHTEYPFLFKKIKQSVWDAEVEKFRAAIPSLEDHEIKVGMTRMVSLFEYGHSQIPFRTLAKEGILPVNLYQFEDGIFIEGAQKAAATMLGAKVLRVENVPVVEALKAIRPVVPVENESYFKAYGLRFLTVPIILHAQGITKELQTTITLTLEKDGKIFDHTFSTIPYEEMSRDYGLTIPNEQWVSARDQQQTPLYLKHLNEKFYFFEQLPDTKTLYVRQSSVFSQDEESLADFYTRLFDYIDSNDIEKLVYDVRLNGGGNNYNNKPLIKGLMARPKINNRGSFFYIIGRNTFSAAQNLTNEIENYTEAILVGEPTAENLNFYGDARRVTLPNSEINAYLSYAWWQDRAPWENKDWTLPHIAVTMTSTDYFTNQDPVLDAALNFTDNGFILNPMDHLTALFIAGKYDEVKSEGAKIAKDPAYKYYDFQDEFGSAGYRLFQNGNREGGIFILELVAEIYPESAGALYSLAGVQEQMDQLEKAKESYKKVISLEPQSTMANTARKKLQALSKE